MMDARRKRLLFRSQRRSSREADILLGGFAARHLEALDARELDRFEALVEREDADLVDWITGRRTPPPDLDDDLMRKLIRHGNGQADR